MKSQVDKIVYLKKKKLMSRVINLLYFKRNKNDNVFNIDVRRSILVYNDEMRYNKTFIVFAKRFVKRSFLNVENKSR